MARTKGGFVTRRSHKKILAFTKGQWGTRSKLVRRAIEAFMKSQWYAYRDRRQRKRQLRALWIARINAGTRLNGMKYSQFIHAMKLANIQLDRKVLADIAARDLNTFAVIVKTAGESLNR